MVKCWWWVLPQTLIQKNTHVIVLSRWSTKCFIAVLFFPLEFSIDGCVAILLLLLTDENAWKWVEWNEQISKDWVVQVMDDYLSAIDDVAKESYVDKVV
jgi:hypothetical protein